MPKVSVIVPVYKTKKYLKKCVDSLLAQTYEDYEIILVDDGSPDDSGALCDLLAKVSSKIKVIHKENGGLTSARKAGVAEARGEYVLFVDSDDYVHQNYIHSLVSALEREQAELAIGSYFLVTEKEAVPKRLPWTESVIAKAEIEEQYQLPLVGRILDGVHVNIPGFMCIRLFRRDCISEEFFISEREVFTEDDVFNLRYSERINKIALVDEPLYYYVQHPESLSNVFRPKKWDMLQKRVAFCEAWLEEHNLTERGQERLAAARFSAIGASIDNAVGSGNYSDFKKELRRIVGSELYRIAKKADRAILNAGQYVVFRMLQMRLWRLLYWYRRRRMRK